MYAYVLTVPYIYIYLSVGWMMDKHRLDNVVDPI